MSSSFPTDEQPLGDRRPLYDRVYRTLRREIELGSLRPGDHLPSERTIAAELGVSRVTVRRAIEELVLEGLVDGRRVASLGEPSNALVSFTSIGAGRGLETSAKVLTATVRDSTIDEADSLKIPPGAPLFELHRLRYLGGLPIAIDESRVPYARVPGIEEIDFTAASLYRTLEERYDIVPTQADYVIEAVAATEHHARLLEVDLGGPLLDARDTMYDQLDRPTNIGRMIYRGDRYRFRTTLVRRP